MSTKNIGLLQVPIFMGITGQKLYICGGGDNREVDFPVKPFEIIETPSGKERVQVIGENRITNIDYKYYDQLPYRQTGIGRDNEAFFVPEFDYLLNLFKEFPDEILKYYPESYNPYVTFVDIETTSLNYEKGEILSIQIAYSDTKPGEEIILLRNSQNSEADLLNEFINLMILSPSGKIPDLCVTYNGNRFDIPFLYNRAKANKMLTKWHSINRANSRIYNQFWLFNRKMDTEIHDVGHGFRTYDMYINAFMDLKLSTLTSRTQKNVARFYGCSEVFDIDISEKEKMEDLLKRDKDRFIKYAISDIKQLQYLWGIYSIRTVAEANLLKLPFCTIQAMSSGQKSYMALYRKARENHFIGLSPNMERYGHLFNRGKFQGAVVGSWAQGYYNDIIYVDAQSMYPSIMYLFNLSPDRYKVLEIIERDDWKEDWDFNKIMVQGTSESLIIYAPDENYNIVCKFEINLVEDGYMREIIEHYNGIRKDYKDIMKKYQNDNSVEGKNKYIMYDSMQNAAKVINNTFYGLNGNKYYEIADLPQAILVTAIGRWIMTDLIKFFGGIEEIPRDDNTWGDTVLEVDSVTGNTPVYVKHKILKNINIIPIEDLHEDPDIKRIAYSGIYEILTRNGWKEIIYTKAHEVKKNIHRIETTTGRVDVTEDHSLFSVNKKEISPRELNIGDKIEILSNNIKERILYDNSYLSNEITANNIVADNGLVYDISTEDGTFVCANGNIVLHNTDGLLIRNDRHRYSIEEINDYLRSRIKEFFLIPEDKLKFTVEYEGAGSIYVYKKKNYILRTNDNKLTIKGSAFVGYDKAPIIKRCVDIMANCIMFNKYEFDEAVEICRDMNQPLEAFMFTKTIKRDPESYKGFENLSTYVMNIENDPLTKKGLLEMKKRATDWIMTKTRKDPDIRRTAKSLIRDCVNYEELLIMSDIIMELLTGSVSNTGNTFMIKLVMQHKANKKVIQEHDIIEYYMTYSKEGYTIAENVTNISQVNINKYLDEINKIIDNFKYSNPLHEELSLW